jgi:PTS system mannose-specific IIA component
VGPQTAIRTVAITPEDDRSAKQAEICTAADNVDTGSGVVIVTDMFGGSPSNLALRACGSANRRILSGANLPMLIKLAKSRGKSLDTAVDLALESGRKYIDAHHVGDDLGLNRAS